MTAPPRRRSLRRLLVLLGVTLFIALLAYGLLSKATDRSIDESLAKGSAPAAPGFDDEVLVVGRPPGRLKETFGKIAEGRTLDLRDLRGTPLVLNFWASWCGPCREEAPVLEAGWRRLGPEGLLFLGLNMQDITGDARDFVAEFHLTYPTVREPSNDTARAYGVTGIPETFFITAGGRVVGHVIGVVDESQLREGARAALDGRIVGSEEGGASRPQR